MEIYYQKKVIFWRYKAFQKSYTNQSKLLSRYNNLGNVYLKQSNYVNSLECYQKSLQIKTNQAETNFVLV